MKLWSRKPRPPKQNPAPAGDEPVIPAQEAGEVGPVRPAWKPAQADIAIAASFLTLTLAVGIPVALRFHQEGETLDRETAMSLGRTKMLMATERRVQARRLALTELRHAADRYVADVEARPVVAWTTALGELSRRRPPGVWATRLSGDGPRFSALVRTEHPDLVAAYTQYLRESPYVDFAAADRASSGTVRVAGRLLGE